MTNVLVFPSHTDGSHQHGLAAVAVKDWGATVGVSEGPSGFSYAIPAFNDQTVMEPKDIEVSIQNFCDHARENIHVNFIVPPPFPLKRKFMWDILKKYKAPPNILFTAAWCYSDDKEEK